MTLSDAGGPLIYAITAGKATSENFSQMIEEIRRQVADAVDENVSMIQIREKQLSGRHLFELASVCANLTRDTLTKLLINDRADIAAAAGADGVHLTSSSIPAAVIRDSFGKTLIIGESVHAAEEAVAAGRNGADFVVFGPVFETPGKGPATAISELTRVCSAASPFPVIALGGINPTNCTDVIHAGAAGVAGIRFFTGRTALRSLRSSMKDGQPE